MVPSRKQMTFFLACAALIIAVAQAGKHVGNTIGHVPNIDKKLRATTRGGGFSKTATENNSKQSLWGNHSNRKQHKVSPEQLERITSSGGATANAVKTLSAWPCMDELDKSLIRISLPVIANFAIAPLVGAIDLVFINRMGNALAVAGQAAANQVFGSVFWLTSFLPSITAIQVSREYAQGNEDAVQEAVCRALFVGAVFAVLGSVALLGYPERMLSSVMKMDAPALEFARPYLKIRGLSFLPALISMVGFSAFRGQMDTTTPVRISLLANLFHAALVPVFIFKFAMGVSGAALATLTAEVISAAAYLVLMTQKKLISMSKLLKIPDMGKVMELLKGGLALQLRNVAFNLTFMYVTRITQSIDSSGVAPAAHAMALQTFQVGGIVLLALSVVAQTVVPRALIETYDKSTQQMTGGIDHARATVKRLMRWGLLLGAALGSLQIIMLPLIMKSTPLQEVRDAARLPALLASVLQVINGLVFIGEGVMVGCGDFMQLSLSTVLASIGCVSAIKFASPRYGLTGVWVGFAAFNGIRLVCVLLHQAYTSPLAKHKTKKTEKQMQ